jgi:hypothetical protein
VFAFAFFLFFIFLLIFGYPLPTPWARFASFWIDFGAIFGSTFRASRRPHRIPAEISQETSQGTRRELSRKLQEMQRTCRELATNFCKELSHKRNLRRRSPFFDATSFTNLVCSTPLLHETFDFLRFALYDGGVHVAWR